MKAGPEQGERGSTLIIVILVSAFLLAVGIFLILITGVGSKVSINVRSQEEAFNAAEAGFEAARLAIENFFLDGVWHSLNENCLKEPAGIDLPQDRLYFRKISDETILQTIDRNSTGVIFYDQPFIRTPSGQLDQRFSYTVFLIDDEAGGGASDPSDVLMVCMGLVRVGNRIVSTARLEIHIGVEAAETGT